MYEKYFVELFEKKLEIFKMKQEIFNLQSEIKAQNCTHSIQLQYILDIESKIKVIKETLRKVSKQIKLIQTSVLMVQCRIYVANNFYQDNSKKKENTVDQQIDWDM